MGSCLADGKYYTLTRFSLSDVDNDGFGTSRHVIEVMNPHHACGRRQYKGDTGTLRRESSSIRALRTRKIDI